MGEALEQRGEFVEWTSATNGLHTTLKKASEKMERYAQRKYVQVLYVAREEVRPQVLCRGLWQRADTSLPCHRCCCVSMQA